MMYAPFPGSLLLYQVTCAHRSKYEYEEKTQRDIALVDFLLRMREKHAAVLYKKLYTVSQLFTGIHAGGK